MATSKTTKVDEFIKKIEELGRQAQHLSRLKIELLREEINATLANDDAPLHRLEHLLDELYAPLMWGYGEKEYRQLVNKVEIIDTEAADYYQAKWDELKNDAP